MVRSIQEIEEQQKELAKEKKRSNESTQENAVAEVKKRHH